MEAARDRTRQDGSFNEYVIADLKNYLFEIDGASATVTRHLSIPKELPGALTSDVVVTEDEVLWNVCAAGVIARVSLEDFRRVTYSATLLRRSHHLDVLDCPRCHGRLRPIAVVRDKAQARRFLADLEKPRAPSRLRAPRSTARPHRVCTTYPPVAPPSPAPRAPRSARAGG